MADHTPYPDFSAHIIQDVVGIARNGSFSQQKPLAAKCAWEVIGAALKVTLGEPGAHEPTFGALENASVEDLEQAQESLRQILATGETFGADEADAAIDPMVLMLMQIAFQLVTKWLENRRQGS